MKADIPLLVAAVWLLWLPRAWLRRGGTPWQSHWRRRSSFRSGPPQDGTSLEFRREFIKARNYFDLGRAVIGGFVLVGGDFVEPALRPVLSPPSGAGIQMLAIQAVILFVGALAQTVRYEQERLSLTAPVFYLAGLSMALCSPWAGLSGFAIAWVMTAAVPSAQSFLTVQALVIAVTVFVLDNLALLPLLGAGLCFFPVLLSLLTRRPLVVFSRRSMSSTRDVNA